MKNKLKSTNYLILSRIWEREKWVFLWFVIAIIVIVACKFVTMSRILECIEVSISFLSKGKDLLYTLAISYISGIFVYYLTVILPETRRSKPILIEIEKSLKYLKDELLDIVDFINTDSAVEIAMHYVKQHKKLDNEFYNMYCSNRILEKIHQSLDTLTSKILSQSFALTQSELETLVDIRHRRISRRLRYKYNKNELLYENEIEKEFEEFVQLNKDIKTLHENIEKRIYKQ